MEKPKSLSGIKVRKFEFLYENKILKIKFVKGFGNFIR